MKPEAFEEFYTHTLVPQLQPFEERRKVIASKMWCVNFVMLGLAGVTIPLVMDMGIQMIGVAVVILCIIYYGLDTWICGSYSKDFKTEVVSRVVKAMGHELSYDPTGLISREDFDRGRLFLGDIDRYSGEDFVRGKVGDTEIRFSEIHAEDRRTRTDSKGRTQHYYVTIFKGIYFVADFHKDFEGQTVVLPDMAEKSFGWFGKALQKMNLRSEKLVQLENPEFEKEFVVYSTSGQQARYILSPSFMEALLAFRRKNGRDIHVSFVNSNVHLALSTGKDHFEPWLFKSILNPELIRGFVDDLRSLLGIVDDLNLNTRIWSKV